MPQGLQIKIEGPDGQQFQSSIATNLQDLPHKWMPVMWFYVVQYFGEVAMGRQFKAEGGYLGGGWNNIDPNYRARKVARFGPSADFIGRRSLQMLRVFTHMHGPGGIFEVGDGGMSVTFGGEVFTEKGEEYSQHFNELRKLFGDGEKLPPEAEFELGKIMSFVYLQVMRLREGTGRSGVEIRMDGELNAPTLDGFRPGPIDKYISDLSSDLGWNQLTGKRPAA